MTRPLAFTALFGALALSSPAQAEIPAGAVPADEAQLRQFRWEARPLLVFAPSVEDPRLAAQMTAFRDAAEDLADRDMPVLVDTDPAAESALRRGIGPEDAVVVLIGKDGGVKYRGAAPVPVSELLDLVDGMPMRQSEISPR